jgi:hypothetical protein
VDSLSIESSLPKHKQLTKFLCQELLYEYVSGSLDREREKAVNDFTVDCRETRHELEKLRSGLHYAGQAHGVQLSAELRDALLNFEPQWKKVFRAWSLWSSQRGWRMLPYVFLTAALALGLAVTRPWKKEVRQETILAEQLRQEPDMLPANSPELTAPAAVSTPVKSGAQPDPNIAQTESKTTEQGKPSSREPRGFILRAEMQVSDFSNSWPAIRDKIVSLNGKVAGNVELGWLRKPDQSYFHFSLPESNMNELELFLGTFGQVRFNKERHPRVMPEGQLRIILTVKDGGNHEGPAEAP